MTSRVRPIARAIGLDHGLCCRLGQVGAHRNAIGTVGAGHPVEHGACGTTARSTVAGPVRSALIGPTAVGLDQRVERIVGDDVTDRLARGRAGAGHAVQVVRSGDVGRLVELPCIPVPGLELGKGRTPFCVEAHHRACGTRTRHSVQAGCIEIVRFRQRRGAPPAAPVPDLNQVRRSRCSSRRWCPPPCRRSDWYRTLR